MKKLAAAIAVIIVMLTLISCGNKKEIIGTKNSYTWAIIELPSGKIIEGEVENWRSFPNKDQIHVKIDGVTYLVHSSDIALMTIKPAD